MCSKAFSLTTSLGVETPEKSSFHLLPKRVAQKKAIEITESCLPLSTQVAKKIGLIDDYFGDDSISFRQQIRQRAEAIAQSPDYDQKLVLKNKKGDYIYGDLRKQKQQTHYYGSR